MNDPRPRIHVDTKSEWAKQGHRNLEVKMSEEMTKEEAVRIFNIVISGSYHPDVARASKFAIKAIEEQPKKVTEKEVFELFTFNESWYKCRNRIIEFFRNKGLLKEEPPKEPEYQWLYKLRGTNEWAGTTKYSTKELFNQSKRSSEYIYERIESSKR
jgi:hypothetical protein